MPQPDAKRSALAPYLSVSAGKKALALYRAAFDAEIVYVYEHEGRIGHAELRINGAGLYLADEYAELEAEIGMVAPPTLGGRTTVTIHLDVDDCDAWHARATGAGCTTVRTPSDEFYGRHAKVRDPFGHVWAFVTPAQRG
ncbi:MAG: VOC family protein [Oceanicaulis sp.]|nr:VOC family protein [Oceanicaulis sp.]